MTGTVLGSGRKLAPDAEALGDAAAGDFIVQFAATPTDANFRRVSDLGGREKARFQAVRAGVFHMSKKAAALVAADPSVAYVSPDRPVQGSLETAARAIDPSGSRYSMALQGNGITVGVIDSGIYAMNLNFRDFTSKSVRTRVVYTANFVASTSADSNDDFGHGTHVAGAIGASDTTNGREVGVAPRVSFADLKVLDSQGRGSDSNVIAAIDRAIQIRSKYNLRVLNLSLGRPVYESYTVDPLCQAVERAWAAGIVVVVAAGNEGRNNTRGTQGYGTITSPGNDPYVITVGAMKSAGTIARNDDQIASYSSKGPTAIDQIVKPDLVAPGNQIVSTHSYYGSLATQFAGNLVQNSVGMGVLGFRLSGTSMAAPMVSGAAAILLQKYPALTPDQVKARLMKTASKSFPSSSVAVDPTTGATYTGYYDLFTVGAGYLDLSAALNSTDAPAGSAVSPKAVYDSSTGKARLVLNGTNLVWGETGPFGTNIVWGTQVLVSGTNLVWGANIVWGTAGTSGFNIVWGTSGWSNSNTSVSEALAVLTKGE